MRRVIELINEVVASCPNDRFFANFTPRLQQLPAMRAYYGAYERAFVAIDKASWLVLKQKAIRHFLQHRTGQLKEGFFNQLNEAFAYHHLTKRGYSNVQFVPEDGTTRPDIAYRDGAKQKYCEVKTIGVSQDEISRRNSPKYVDRSGYAALNSGFLGKLGSDLCRALAQINAQHANGLVFIIVNFDDFTLSYYGRYRKQIVRLLSTHEAPEVFIKVGLFGNRRIHKAPRAHR